MSTSNSKTPEQSLALIPNHWANIRSDESFFTSICKKIFWGGADDKDIANILLSYIPYDFSGELLEMPLDTSLYSYEKYREIREAKITCVDSDENKCNFISDKMKTLKNVKCLKGEIENLDFPDNNFDIVLSMNGIHTYKDKEKAIKEIHRILKKDGKFLCSFYIEGESFITDSIVSYILVKKGLFVPPFYNRDNLRELLNSLFQNITYHIDGSIVYFICNK